MTNNVENFVTEFQDMFITKRNTLERFPEELSHIELKIIDQQLKSIREDLSSLSSLTNKAITEQKQTYIKLKETLDSKIDYVSSLSDMLLYINSFYDMSNVVDVKNYEIIGNSQPSSLVYDSSLKGLTLKHVYSTSQCSHSQISGNSVVFYNTNSSYHSGISLESPFLDVLKIKSVFIRKVDGTVINLPLRELRNTREYIAHDFINSTQVVVEFEDNIDYLPTEQQDFYKSLSLSLLDYKYEPYGSFVLKSSEYKKASSFNFITQEKLPADSFINLLVDLTFTDINNNTVDEVSLTLPINQPYVCKSLDKIDKNSVGSLISFSMGGETFEDTFKLEDLEGYSERNEIYIKYIPKTTLSDSLNNNIKIYNNQGFFIKNKNIKNIYCSITVEMYSFNKNTSPLLKMIAGVTKHG